MLNNNAPLHAERLRFPTLVAELPQPTNFRFNASTAATENTTIVCFTTAQLANELVSTQSLAVHYGETFQLAARRYISKSDERFITIARSISKSVPSAGVSIAVLAIPPAAECAKIEALSQETARPHGPGDTYPGALGVAYINFTERQLKVSCLQSCYNSSLAVEQNLLSKKDASAYGRWAAEVIKEIFAVAERYNFSEIVFDNRSYRFWNFVKAIGLKNGFSEVASNNSNCLILSSCPK